MKINTTSFSSGMRLRVRDMNIIDFGSGAE